MSFTCVFLSFMETRHLVTIFTLLFYSLHLSTDLLHERAAVSIMEDAFGVVQLVNVKEHKISSAEEFLAFIEQGAQLRRTEETLCRKQRMGCCLWLTLLVL